MLRSLTDSPNGKTVVLPASTPGGYRDLYEQMTSAMLTSQESIATPMPPASPAPRAPRV